jgi:hypothetical protein
MAERVLFFSPHAGIWQHAFPEALIADAIGQSGADVVYVTCGGVLSSFCVVMASRGLRIESAAADKERVCVACRANRDLLRSGFHFDGYDLDSVLGPEEEARVRVALDGADRTALREFTVDGLRIGRATLYEYLIHHKKSDLTLSEAEWHSFRPILANAIRSAIAARRIFDRERPTRLVLYNSLYSVNAVWRALADERGIPVYTLHAGPSLARRLATMLIARDSTIATANRLMKAWPRFEKLPCHAEDLAQVTDHFCEVLRGTNVFAYSAPKSGEPRSWRADFGIRPEQKLLVATMSSYDEYVAGRAAGEQPQEDSLLFPTQLAWIRALTEWISAKPDRFLLIRVHPREFPNKREGLKSEHARMLERELASLPPNARVNWPTDGLSLYDIAEHTDVFLNAWSSVGKEMSLFGIPVVVYCPSLLMYAPELNYVGETQASYFAAIERALGDGWSFEHIRQAYRWSVLEYVRVIADLSDGFEYSEQRATSFLGRARNLLLALPEVRQQRDFWRRPRSLREGPRVAALVNAGGDTLLDVPSESSPASEHEETLALRHELGRLLHAMYGAAPGPVMAGSLRARLVAAAEGA